MEQRKRVDWQEKYAALKQEMELSRSDLDNVRDQELSQTRSELAALRKDYQLKIGSIMGDSHELNKANKRLKRQLKDERSRADKMTGLAKKLESALMMAKSQIPDKKANSNKRLKRQLKDERSRA